MAKRKRKIRNPELEAEREALSREADERMKRILDKIRAEEAAEAEATAKGGRQ